MEKNNLDNYYDSISQGYEELHKEEQLKKIEIIKQYLKPRKTDKLLDVGCGTGLTTMPWNCQRYGIDPAKKLIEKAIEKNNEEIIKQKKNNKRKKKINYKIAQAENIPYPDKYFDYVISITAIQNFQDIEKGLKEIKRVGKGKYILSFLKKSKKAQKIKKLIYKIFDVKKEIEEEKDYIMICD